MLSPCESVLAAFLLESARGGGSRQPRFRGEVSSADQGEDVAVGVLEPSGLHVPTDVHVAIASLLPSLIELLGPQRRLKNCTARSCRLAAAKLRKVPRFLRFPVRGFFLRE